MINLFLRKDFVVWRQNAHITESFADINSSYKKLIALRKELPVFRDGRFTLLCPEDEQLFAYTRDTETEHLLVVCNFSGREASFDFPAEYRGAECLVSNYKEPSVQTIRPYEAWMLIKKEC